MLPCLDTSRMDPSSCGDPAILVITKVSNKQLKRRFHVRHWTRDVVQDALKQRRKVVSQIFRITCFSSQSIGINDWELKKFAACSELNKQIKGCIQCLVSIRIPSVKLVDDHDGWQVFGNGLFEHETGLWFGTFHRVHQQQHTINHVHDPFDLPTEVSMSGRVNDVDLDQFSRFEIRQGDGCVLCQNRNPAFSFQIIGIHDAFLDLLVFPEDLSLFQHGINQGRLPMIHMRDDRNISDILTF